MQIQSSLDGIHPEGCLFITFIHLFKVDLSVGNLEECGRSIGHVISHKNSNFRITLLHNFYFVTKFREIGKLYQNVISRKKEGFLDNILRYFPYLKKNNPGPL